MRPDFDAQIHALLDDAAREIPPDATVLPGLLRQIARTDQSRSFTMRPLQRILAPAIAGLLVVALVITFISIHATHQSSIAVQPTATATATPAPSASFTPSTITQHGLTIQLDHVDANAFRIAVNFHYVTLPPHPGDEFDAVYPQVVDETGITHFAVNPTIVETPGAPGTAYRAYDFAPLTPAPAAPHTLHFLIPRVLTIGSEGSNFKQFTDGPWDFTIHVVPAISGSEDIHTAAQMVGGISITPQSIAWTTGGDAASQAAVVRLALSGLPKVADPARHPFYFSVDPHYEGDDVTKDEQLIPAGAAPQNGAYFILADAHFDAAIDTQFSANTGSIHQDGTAVVDVGFQNVQLAPGMHITLTINVLRVTDSYTFKKYLGTWTFAITL